jgi:hypothetical protein
MHQLKDAPDDVKNAAYEELRDTRHPQKNPEAWGSSPCCPTRPSTLMAGLGLDVKFFIPLEDARLMQPARAIKYSEMDITKALKRRHSHLAYKCFPEQFEGYFRTKKISQVESGVRELHDEHFAIDKRTVQYFYNRIGN